MSRTAIFDFDPAAVTCGTIPCTGGTAFVGTNAHYRSHSLMLSLVYNFAAPPSAASASASASASAAACRSGDADLPGRIGDPGDGHLPGSAASASASGLRRGERGR